MNFSNYIWDLYRNSKQGRKEIRFFKNLDIDKLSKKFNFCTEFEYYDNKNTLQRVDIYQELLKILEGKVIHNFEQAKLLFSKWVIDEIKDQKYNVFIEFIEACSTALFKAFPDFFLPFYFDRKNFPDFILICENFGIPLPPFPKRQDWNKRTEYYFDICETLQRFRKKFNINSQEFPAFLYFFGVNLLVREEEEELPKPSRIYFLGAGNSDVKEEDNVDFDFLDNADKESVSVWGAGSLKIKKGDLLLMYCLSPRKYVHSIWKAIEDSYIDPFSFYYYNVKVGFPYKVTPIPFQELKENKTLGENPVIKAHMQGMNGRPLTTKEYAELLRLLEQKGQNVSELPKLPVYDRNIEHVENERDVEKKLIEPLLKDIGFKEKDWVRQLPLKMERKIKYYPDYAIRVNMINEKAQIVLEAKYSINSDKQLRDAFDQARSYGLRLQSDKIILADRDFVWVFGRLNGDFNPNPDLKLHWNDLTNSDNLYILKEELNIKR
jgi:hypothetical protein